MELPPQPDRLKTECLALAKECSLAEPDRERELFYAAYEALRPKTNLSLEQGNRFRKLVDSQCYESAAAMLWPPELAISVRRPGPTFSGGQRWEVSGWVADNNDVPSANVQTGGETEGLARISGALMLWTL